MTPRAEHVARASALYRRGDMAGARAEAEAALGAGEAEDGLRRFLADICCRMGDFSSGATHLRLCLDGDPGNAGIRAELARALAALGALDEAYGFSATDGATGADEAALAQIRGFILQNRGAAAEAAACYEQVLAHQPGDFETWNNLGNARRQAGDLGGAIEALRRAAALRGDIAPILLNLGSALADAGRLEESLAACEQAARLAPPDRTCLVELGRALNRIGRPAEALAPLAEAERIAPDDAEVQIELGQIHAALGELARAEACYRRAIALRPDGAEAWNDLALLLESSNRAEALGALLDEAAAAGVKAGELGFARALHARREGRLEDALALARAAPAATEPHRKAQLIGEVADRLGDAKTAFAAFSEMNRVLAAVPSDPRAATGEYRREVAARTALLTPEFQAAWRQGPVPSGRPAPVFLVGFPRSGTTLLDTILMGHRGIQVIEEQPLLREIAARQSDMARLTTLDDEEIIGLRALYFDTLDCHAEVVPEKLVIDKMPLNMGNAILLHRLFPEARFIFAERHPADVVLSCFITNFRLNEAMANFLDLADAAALYDMLMTHWQRCRTAFALRVHAVRYERMIADLEGEMRPLIAYLGVDWEPEALDHRRTADARGYVSTASYAQVTEPIYDRASGRWRRYRDEMADVLPLLAKWAERLGYPM